MLLVCFSEGQYLCKWFIGLVFHSTQTANIDLTYDIQSFSDAGQSVVSLSVFPSYSLSLVPCAACNFTSKENVAVLENHKAKDVTI